MILGILIVNAGCIQPGSSINHTSPPNLTQTTSVSTGLPAASQNTNSLKYISSNPEGASIYLDGSDTDQQSNGLLSNLTPGSHTIILKLAGYFDSMQQIIASPQGGDPTSIQLIRIPGGSIIVNSDPAGAVIYLDDTYTGKRTLDTLTEIIPGSHHIVIHRDGYSESGQQVSIIAGQGVNITLPLKKIPDSYGNISVTSDPKRIEMYLDGEPTSQMTNSVLNTVPVGIHTIILRNPGYTDVNELVIVLPNQTSYVNTNQFLYQQQYEGIQVESVPTGADIFLDGTDTGKTTNTCLTTIHGGEHRITLHLDGYSDEEWGVTVPGDGKGYVHAEFHRPLNNSISLNSSPSGATIYMGGHNTGKTTNATLKMDQTAADTVTFHMDGYYDSSQMVQSRPDTTVNVFAPLTRVTSGSVSVVSKPVGARISLDGVDTGKTTNSIVDNISPGLHAISLNLPGYYPASQAIVITEGQTVVDYASLIVNPDSPDRPKPTTPVPTYGEDNWIPEPVGLATSYPEFPRTMMVYRVIPEDPGEKLGELSKKFNISGDLKMYDTSWIIEEYNSTSQERYELSVDLGSGYFEYSNVNRLDDTDPRDLPEFVPADDEARQIGENYLENKGLLPDDALFNHIGDSGEESVVGNVTTISKYVVIDYMRKINGTIVNDRISVTVGGGGDILRVSGHWPKIEPYKEIPLISPEEAFKELQKNVTYGNVTNISLEYYSGTRDKQLNYILPVYVFRGMGPGMCDGQQAFEYKIIATQIMNESGAIQRYDSFY